MSIAGFDLDISLLNASMHSSSRASRNLDNEKFEKLWGIYLIWMARVKCEIKRKDD